MSSQTYLNRPLVSILGDSVSTFKGFNPEGYAVFYDEYLQSVNGLSSVYDTWWAKVNQSLNAYLCVNDSYSGSRVTGADFPSATSEIRLNNLKKGNYIPNIILIYIGTNDFGNGIPVTRADCAPQNEWGCFEIAYDYLLKSLTKKYPQSMIICGTLMRSKMRGKEDWVYPEEFAGYSLESYNNVIRQLSYNNCCYLADVSKLGLYYETLDGSHPTKEGHETIFRAWNKCLNEIMVR